MQAEVDDEGRTMGMTVDVFSSAPTLTSRASEGVRTKQAQSQSQLHERRPHRIEQKKTGEIRASRTKRRIDTGADAGAGSSSMSASAARAVNGVRPTPDAKRVRIA